MYKGYTVREIILNDYQNPETAIIVDVPCGCRQCQEAGEIQTGHFACGLLPDNLRDDKNIYPRLERNEWYAEFLGDNEFVDEWVINPKSAAAALGRLGGKSTSKAKVAAARTNGRKGGRPKKS